MEWGVNRISDKPRYVDIPAYRVNLSPSTKPTKTLRLHVVPNDTLPHASLSIERSMDPITDLTAVTSSATPTHFTKFIPSSLSKQLTLDIATDMPELQQPKFNLQVHRVPVGPDGGRGEYRYVVDGATVNEDDYDDIPLDTDLIYFNPYFPIPYDKENYPDQDDGTPYKFTYGTAPEDPAGLFEHTEREHEYIEQILRRFKELA